MYRKYTKFKDLEFKIKSSFMMKMIVKMIVEIMHKTFFRQPFLPTIINKLTNC